MYYFFKVYHENLTKFRLFFQIDKIIKIVVQFDEQITLPFFFDPKLNLRPSTAKYYFPPKVTKPTILMLTTGIADGITRRTAQ